MVGILQLTEIVLRGLPVLAIERSAAASQALRLDIDGEHEDADNSDRGDRPPGAVPPGVLQRPVKRSHLSSSIVECP